MASFTCKKKASFTRKKGKLHTQNRQASHIKKSPNKACFHISFNFLGIPTKNFTNFTTLAELKKKTHLVLTLTGSGQKSSGLETLLTHCFHKWFTLRVHILLKTKEYKILLYFLWLLAIALTPRYWYLRTHYYGESVSVVLYSSLVIGKFYWFNILFW